MDKIGKIDLKTFEGFLQKRLGAPSDKVLVPPLTGVDAGVVDIGDGKVMIIAEDPIFQVPGQAIEMFGWYTVHIGASDVAVMGVKPQFMTYSLLMPPSTSDDDFRGIVDSIHETAEELDITIVGGHTGYYPTVTSPLIGGITVFSIADKGSYVTPMGARPGNDVLLTKGPAIETVGILAALQEKRLLENHPKELVEKAKALCKQMTVVKDARVAMKAGGVTAMHDATEGGVIGGLYEVAAASGVGMEVDENRFIYPEEIRFVCEELGIDPVAAIAEGSLIITCESGKTEGIIDSLRKNGIESSVIGKVLKDSSKRTMERRSGKIAELEIPEQDPFWPAFFEALGA